jgi:hypothetical protein
LERPLRGRHPLFYRLTTDFQGTQRLVVQKPGKSRRWIAPGTSSAAWSEEDVTVFTGGPSRLRHSQKVAGGDPILRRWESPEKAVERMLIAARSHAGFMENPSGRRILKWRIGDLNP